MEFSHTNRICNWKICPAISHSTVGYLFYLWLISLHRRDLWSRYSSIYWGFVFYQPNRRNRMFLSLYYSLFINPQYCFGFCLCCRIMSVSFILMHTLTYTVLLQNEISKWIHYPALILLLWKKTEKWYASVIVDGSAEILWFPLWLSWSKDIEDSGRGWGKSGRHQKDSKHPAEGQKEISTIYIIRVKAAHLRQI